MVSQDPESKLHALFLINVGSDINEICCAEVKSVYCHKLYKTLLKHPAV